MHWYLPFVILLISAFSGWVVTRIATKILFYPLKPLRILGYTVQGIFLKNQDRVAGELGKVVSNELLPFSVIEQKITDQESLQKLKPEIEKHIDEFVNKKLRDVFPILSKFIGVKTTNQLKEAFMQELESIFPVMMKKYMIQLKGDIDLGKLVTLKISGFSSEKIGSIFNAIVKNELKNFEVIGAFFGLFMGIIQVLLLIFFT